MFATIKSLIPEPRQGDHPRKYVGKHRQPEPAAAPASSPTSASSSSSEAVEPASVVA